MNKQLFAVAVSILLCASLPQFAHSADELSAGRASFEAGNFDDALAHLDAFVDAYPTNGDAHYWRAKCLVAMNRGRESAGEFRMAMMLSTDAAIKEDAKAQLQSTREALPAGSIGARPAGKELFKLESRKLDWNMPATNTLKTALDEGNHDLRALVEGGPQRSQFSAQLKARQAPLDVGTALSQGPVHAGAISAPDMNILINSDIVVILDHSGSMTCDDCPIAGPDGKPTGKAQSRLEWSTDELLGFSRQLFRASTSHGITFITFDTDPTGWDLKSAGDFDQVLHNIRGGGGTSLSPALEMAFRHHQSHLNQPLLIAVVSDCQIPLKDSIRSMVEGTRVYPLPKGVFYTFMQIGIMADRDSQIEGPESAFGVTASIRNLRSLGANYDATQIIPFSKLRQIGLGPALLTAFKATTAPAYVNAPPPVLARPLRPTASR